MQFVRGAVRTAPDVGGARSANGVNSGLVTSGGNWSSNTWTGNGEQNDFQYVVVSLQTDEAGTLYFDFSVDGSNYVTFPPSGFTVASGTHEIHSAIKAGRHFRPRFVGSGGRTYFRLVTYYANTPLNLNSPLNQTLSTDSDALTVRSVLTGVDPITSEYTNVRLGLGGTLGTSEFLAEVAQGHIAGTILFTKFGRNPDVDNSTDPEDVWNGGGLYTGQPASGNAETVTVSSGSANDTSAGTGARTVRIVGLDANWLDHEETVTLNGTSLVTSASTYRRVFRAYTLTAGSGGSNAGEITVAHSTTTANIFAKMPVGANQTLIGAYTIPAGKTAHVRRLVFGMGRDSGTAGSAVVAFLTREFGSVYRTRRIYQLTDSLGLNLPLFGDMVLPEKTDIVVRVNSVSDNETGVTAEFTLLLVDN